MFKKFFFSKRNLFISFLLICFTNIFVNSLIAEIGSNLDSFLPENHRQSNQRLVDCLNQKGATMFGSLGCSSCQYQKELLGIYFEQIDFVDCTISRNNQNFCRQNRIHSYPTWLLSDGRELEFGELEYLAEQAGCLEKR